MRSSVPVQSLQFDWMLILLPTGLLLATVVVFDMVDLATGTGAFAVAAYWLLVGGVMAGLMAGPLALMAWLQLPAGSSARRLGMLHVGCIAAILLLFLGSWLLRDGQGGVPQAALVLSFLAAIVSVVAPVLCTVLASRTGADEPSAGPSAGAH